MDNGIILYQSKYGSTKRYADILQLELQFVTKDIKEVTLDELSPYKTIILCGAIYASGISGLKVIKSHYPSLKGKTIVVLAVGASPYQIDALNDIYKHNFSVDYCSIPLFYARGEWDESKMSFKDKTLCKMLYKAVKNKKDEDLEPWMKALLSSSGKKCDWVDSQYLKPLLAYLKETV